MPTLSCHNLNTIMTQCRHRPTTMPTLSCNNANSVLLQCQHHQDTMPTLSYQNANTVLSQYQHRLVTASKLQCDYVNVARSQYPHCHSTLYQSEHKKTRIVCCQCHDYGHLWTCVTSLSALSALCTYHSKIWHFQVLKYLQTIPCYNK